VGELDAVADQRGEGSAAAVAGMAGGMVIMPTVGRLQGGGRDPSTLSAGEAAGVTPELQPREFRLPFDHKSE
jgi:hypothetical protein